MRPLFAVFVYACTNTTKTADPADVPEAAADCDVANSWDEASHGALDAPLTDRVFDPSVVHRLSLTVPAEDYAAMYAELESLTGMAFGAGGGFGGDDGLPEMDTGSMGELLDAMAEACEGLVEGDACAVDLGGFSIDGLCQVTDGALLCVPDESGGFGGVGGEGDLTFLPSDPSYHAVTVEADGQRWCSVGMRFKGNATLISAWQEGVAKLPFRLNFDRYEDEQPALKNQRFFGFKEITFGNGQGDPTLLHEVLANEIFQDRGVPAARNAFYAVSLDAGEGPQYLGLYTAMEDPSDAMMARVFGDGDGNLYKPDGDCATLSCFDEDSFEKKNHEDEADWSDVEALVAALGDDRSDAEAWRAGLEATVDVRGFLAWLAVNTAIQNWDAYGGMAHNYYLYGVPDEGGRLAWIPWDHNLSLSDESMGGLSDPLQASVGDEWPMIRRVLDDPSYAETYRLLLADALQGAYEVSAFDARAAELAELVRPYLFGADGEVAPSTFLSSEADWDAALDAMRAHVQARHEEIEAALAE